MKRCIYPGSFDPFTNGHADIARRAARLCDELIVAVLHNRAKEPAFTLEERVAMAARALKDVPNCRVDGFEGLMVDYFRKTGATAVVRGLRSESDFRYEAEIAAANRILLPEFESILLPCRTDLAFTSAKIVREVASYGGDIRGMVPPEIADEVARRLLRRDLRGEAPLLSEGEG